MKDTIKTIGIIGSGKFGKFFAKKILPIVFPQARITLSSKKQQNDDINPLKNICQFDLVILAVPIREMENVLLKISSLLKNETTIMDVCSVKMLPVQWMKRILPKTINIIASHPMFGVSSYEKVKFDLSKLTMVMHPVRIDKNLYEHIYDMFSTHLKIVEMDPKTHDKKTAKFQFTSHLINKILHTLMMSRSSIDTKSASLMFDLMDVLHSDSDELFLDIYRFNPYAKKQLDKITQSFQKVTSLLKSL